MLRHGSLSSSPNLTRSIIGMRILYCRKIPAYHLWALNRYVENRIE